MIGWLPMAAALPFAALLLSSGAYADRRFARFDELPAHFDLAGKATRMAPRRTMAWMLPILFSIALVAIAILTSVLPRHMQNGDPVAGVIVGGLGLLAAQALVLWLTERWARSRR